MAIDDIESQPDSSEDGALTDEEDPRRPLLNSIRQKLGELEPPLTSKCCIYRVRGSLRKLNEDAYTPRVISIGPFHRGKKELQIMEKHKDRYLHDFLKRAEANKVSLEDLVTSIGEWEEGIRRCYAETIKLSSNDFIQMILLDGSFIIEYFMRRCFQGDFISENDEVLYKPWLEIDIRSDLILLENQLPFFLLEELYNRAFPIDQYDQRPSFLEIVCNYFPDYNLQKKTPQGPEVKHFTELVRTFHLPLSPTSQTEKQTNQFSNCAKKLHEAGVKVKVSSSNCLKHEVFRKNSLT